MTRQRLLDRYRNTMLDVGLLLHDLGLGKEIAQLVHEGLNENEIGAIKGALHKAYRVLETVTFDGDTVSFSTTYTPGTYTRPNPEPMYGIDDF